MADKTGRELIYSMLKSFVPQHAAGVDAVIQYHLAGEGGGDFIVTIKDQKITVADGVHEKPNVTIICSAEDYVKISSGEMDGTKAFFTGKLKLKGDSKVALGMQKWFK